MIESEAEGKEGQMSEKGRVSCEAMWESTQRYINKSKIGYKFIYLVPVKLHM